LLFLIGKDTLFFCNADVKKLEKSGKSGKSESRESPKSRESRESPKSRESPEEGTCGDGNCCPKLSPKPGSPLNPHRLNAFRA